MSKQRKKDIPKKTKLFYTDTGFGVKGISIDAIKKNIHILRKISKEGSEFYRRKEMKKEIDREIINARNAEINDTVQEAIRFEKLNNQGRSPEDITEEARKYLKISEDDSVLANAEDKIKSINRKARLLIDVNSLTNRLIDASMVSDEELAVLNKVEQGLANDIQEIYGITEDELYGDA